jgi:hypothetical protein
MPVVSEAKARASSLSIEAPVIIRSTSYYRKYCRKYYGSNAATIVAQLLWKP